jgi:exodeoxyribonuclease V alpha subunit
MNKGPCGTRALNELLQQALNPAGEKIPFSARKLFRGDRVMQLRNDYEKDVFNGDVGLVTDFDREKHTVVVDFDGRPVSYESCELDDLDIAYAVTVHKSQGSEYPAVIIAMLSEHHVMLQRNLLYTAVSRGKRVVVLVGDPAAVNRAVNNARERLRYSRLAERLNALAQA